MIIPLGDWLLFSIGLLSLTEWRIFRLDRSLRLFPLLWICGWVLENIVKIPGPWHWHFSRLLALLGFVVLAWSRSQERKIVSLLLTSLTLFGQDLFLVNEPGMFKYDQWIFALVVISIAFLSAQSLWGMGFALAGGILINLGFSVFFFNGIVRHYDLPDPFVWHLSIAFLVGSSAFTQIRSSLQIRSMKPVSTVTVSNECLSEEIEALAEQEPTVE